MMNVPNTVTRLRIALDESPMTRGQLIAVVLMVLVAGLDGYDVQSMSFVAPVVSKVWGIGKATLGLTLACSLFGMAAGSLGLSPLADVVGRRPAVLGGILLMTIGSLLSALSHTVRELAASRALTGLGIGVLVPLTTAIAAEFSNFRRRGFAVAATTVGFSLGGVTGGLIAAAILKAHPWLWVFNVGAAAGAVLLLLTAVGLPESPAFLIDRRPREALHKLNRVLLRLGQAPLTDLPRPLKAEHASYRALFAAGMAAVTIRFAIVYMLVVTAAYYLLSWLPQLIADAGYPPSTASLVSATSALVGVPAGLIFGALAARIGPMRLAASAMIGFGAALAGIGFVPPALPYLLIAASACGFFLAATTAVFYASMTATFPPLMRVSGMGLVMGTGRLVSGLGPFLAGVMFAAGLTRTAVSLTFAAIACLGGIILAFGYRR
jgi:MFS family permease